MPATNNRVARRAPRRVVLPWHKVVGVIALPIVLLAVGCTKSSCDQVPVAKVDFPWTDSLQLIPPGAKVCGVHASIPNELSVDFGEDPNPFVTIVKHLEGKHGWRRTHQEVDNKDSQVVDLEKDGLSLGISVLRVSGRTPHASFNLTSMACAREVRPAVDGSVCLNETTVTNCKHRNVLGKPGVCKPGESCTTDKDNGEPGPAPSAHCRAK